MADRVVADTRTEDRASVQDRSVATYETLFLLGPLLFLVFAWPFLHGTDPDYWWHARTGALIWEERALPRVDPYSYTAQGHAWTMHEWLSELLFFAVESGVGYRGNVALFGALGAATALLVYRTTRQWGVGELPAALLMLWAFVLMAGSLNVRPQAFTAFFVAVQTHLLTRFKASGQARPLRLLPALYVLWVNLHGGYVIGLVLLGLTVGGEWLSGRSARPAARVKPLVLVTALCAVATLANPYGWNALLYPLGYAGTGNASMQFIQEWQSPDFHRAGDWWFAAAAAAILVAGLAHRPLGITETLWVILTFAMGLLSMRHIQLFGIVATPVLGARAREALPAFGRTLAAWRRPATLAVLWPVVLVALVTLPLRQGEQPAIVQVGLRPSSAGYPSGGVEFIRAHGLRGPLLNDYKWGGYLIYELYPEHPVFVDGRADVYGDSHMKAYMDIEWLRPGWQERVAEFGIRLALLDKDGSLAYALAREPGWELVYEGEVEALLVRTDTQRPSDYASRAGQDHPVADPGAWS